MKITPGTDSFGGKFYKAFKDEDNTSSVHFYTTAKGGTLPNSFMRPTSR